ncbi:GTPase Der [Kiloniella litopenaei]|uniref:GTPase Der n=1 Tax=Kiloniella litopenaei TaxID=1549748 RepID=A0A0M2R4I5_9PROT|nr:ribosome biogenesis GTPase Der [Kiloniella litopenaei]KKJ76581.1 GTPase Der [Kiloniella litopenaei]
MTFTVAIVGRPNVGKSTLFNRLVGKRLALVDDQPGVTRDRREGDAYLFDCRFRIIDTAGLEEAFDGSLEARMRRQTERAVEESDLVIMVIDARVGVMPIDEHFAKYLRRGKTPIALMANKCEGKVGEEGLMEAYSLGLGEPIPFSAEHGLGSSDLYDVIKEHMTRAVEEKASSDVFEKSEPIKPAPAMAAKAAEAKAAEESDSEDDEYPEDEFEGFEDDGEGRGPLQLAIVGRPNVGKSTLINKLIDEDRLLTGPEAGITRDAIAIEWEYRGKPLKLVDTAGLRRRSKIEDKVEKLSASDTIRALKYAQVVALVLDADGVLEKQDLTIARTVIDEGRALVIVVNKWDTCKDKDAVMQRVKDRLQTSLPQVKGIPVVTISALKGHKLNKMLDTVFDIYDVWNIRLPTAGLNRWLAELIERHPPPAPGGRRIKLKYITQARTRPPTFAISCSLPEDLPASYTRFLENNLRETFDMPGVPLRMHMKKGDNPYAGKKKRN